jgi:hypothetical protein
MELFNSYVIGNSLFCDSTTAPTFPDPNSRVLCTELENFCAVGCGSLGVDNGLILCSTLDSWNCNLCANDVPFWIPFETGDTFDFQFQQPNKLPVGCENGWLPSDLLSPTNYAFATFEIRSCCSDTPLEVTEEIFAAIAPEHYVGFFNSTDYSGIVTQQSIHQIRFDLNAIATYLVGEGLEPCFYFKFTFTGSRECLGESEIEQTFYSEPFKMIPCSDGEKSQLVESIYPRTDCFGSYYGTNFEPGMGGSQPFQYSNRIRVPGSFERTNFSITKETIGATLRTTAAQYCETWLMRTANVPEVYTKYLVNLLTGRDVYVNGTEYQIQGDIAKNNETGSQWFLEINFERCECDKPLTCE